jgi:hypothetical protein
LPHELTPFGDCKEKTLRQNFAQCWKFIHMAWRFSDTGFVALLLLEDTSFALFFYICYFLH